MQKNEHEAIEKEDLVAFAVNVSSTGAGKPSEEAKHIMFLYANDIIDYETAESMIRKLHHIDKK